MGEALQENIKNLVSISIIEKDVNGDVLPVWSYPEVTAEQEELLVNRSNLTQETIPTQFAFSKYKNDWIYTYIHIIDPNKVKMVVAFCVCIIASDFNPEKYLDMGKLLGILYKSTNEPVSVLDCWLNVFTKGSYNSKELGTFTVSSYDQRKAFLATSVKDLIRMFGEDIILIWNALIMKKRIVIYSEKLGMLLKLIRAIPLLVFHRQNWNLLRPYMTLTEPEINDLKATGVYCAGFTKDTIKDREDLYDLLIDVNNRSISVASHAKADFAMTSVHRDICEFLVSSADDNNITDQEIIKGLVVKTKELLSKLERLKVDHEDGSYIDYKTLQNTKLPANMDRFLFAVATAEGMTKI